MLRRIEKATRQGKREHLCVLSPGGQVLFEREGDLDHIPIADLSADLFEGNVVTHNHPNGDSFSRGDVRLLLSYKAAQIRVVTSNWTYMLDLPEDTEWDDVDNLVKIIRIEVENLHKLVLARGIMTLQESDNQYWHDVWSGVAEVRGWAYRREKAE